MIACRDHYSVSGSLKIAGNIKNCFIVEWSGFYLLNEIYHMKLIM